MRTSLALILALATGAALPEASAKTGAQVPAFGAKSLGRGSADVAIPDDATSISRNPALIMELERTRIDLSLMYMYGRTRWVNERNDTLDESGLAFPVPFFALAWDPYADEVTPLDGAATGTPGSLDDVLASPTVGSGFRFGFSNSLLAAGGGESDLKTSIYPDGETELLSFFVVALAPTFGFRISDRLSFGVAPQLLLFNMSNHGLIGSTEHLSNGIVRVHKMPDGTPVDPPQPFEVGGEVVTWKDLFSLTSSGEPAIRFEVDDTYGIGFSLLLGLHWRPMDNLSIGFAAQAPGWIPKGWGKAKVLADQAISSVAPELEAILGQLFETFLPNGTNQGLSGNYDFEIENYYSPGSVTVGLGWHPHPRWLLALDLRYIFWAQAFDTFKVKLKGGSNPDINEINGTDTILYESKLKWRDSFGISIGTAFAVTDWLVLRTGYNYQSSPFNASYTTPTTAITEHGISFGGSVYWERWDFDLGLMWALPEEMNISDHRSLDEWDHTSFKSESYWIYLNVGYQF